jgi:hypothetical protein
MLLALILQIAEGPEDETQCRWRPKSSKVLCKLLQITLQQIHAKERSSQNSDRHFAINETPTAATNAEPHFAGRRCARRMAHSDYTRKGYKFYSSVG